MRTQLTEYYKNIESLLTKQVQELQTGSSDFRWYLSLQLDDVSTYDAKVTTVEKHDNPYPSMLRGPSVAPSLYAEASHYQRYPAQSQALSVSTQANTVIQWVNCMQPHSLHYRSQQQHIATDVSENTPFHVQLALAYTNSVLQQSQNNHSADVNDVANIHNSELPTSAFADNVFEQAQSRDQFNAKSGNQ